MLNPFFNHDLISTKEMTLEMIQLILKTTDQLKNSKRAVETIAGKVVASCFFEPSTRTRLSFESAALRMGARVIGFSGDQALSMQKGETLADTMRVIDGFADLIIIRHPEEGAARLTAEIVACPVVNGGDGANQHPTQALVDLYAIHACQKKLDGLSMALVGDLKYGRTIHSLLDLCAFFDIRLYFVSPELLSLSESVCDILKKRGVRFSCHRTIEEVIPKIDILYMTRIQKERFSPTDYELVKNQFILIPDLFKQAKDNLRVLHPLPRVNEITREVDKTPYAYYFEQAHHGVFVRQAILTLMLNEVLP
ncbi:MAG: aspartate carbamoyltransferase [Gammaproteobacteria bacterium RIFCSPHIGHO2_12_FULL_42_10]|nr:MAG: aspartate carbamoyltransferase [Gammaproteobacteria bacterium RIFCSPHIGHO2_12_FULL_42_10]